MPRIKKKEENSEFQAKMLERILDIIDIVIVKLSNEIDNLKFCYAVKGNYDSKKIRSAEELMDIISNEKEISEIENRLKNYPDISVLKKIRHLLTSNFEAPIKRKLEEELLKLAKDFGPVEFILTEYVKYHNEQVVLKKEKLRQEKEEKEASNVVKIIKPEQKNSDKVETSVIESEILFDFEEDLEERIYSETSLNILNSIDSGLPLEHVVNLLPLPNYKDYYKIKNDLLDLLEDRYFSMVSYAEGFDDEYKENIVDSANYIEYQINLFNDYFESLELDGAIENDANQKERKLIFAKTKSGNIFINNDLKDIPREYKDNVLKLLEKLKNGYDFKGVNKTRVYTNNGDLNGVIEIKAFKVRLVYQIVSENYCLVTQVIFKKSQNDKRYRNAIASRYHECQEQYNSYLKLSQNGKIDQIDFEEENLVYEDIVKDLDSSFDSSYGAR